MLINVFIFIDMKYERNQQALDVMQMVYKNNLTVSFKIIYSQNWRGGGPKFQLQYYNNFLKGKFFSVGILDSKLHLYPKF